MHLHHCRCFQEHVRMLLHSLREFRRAPGGAGSISKYWEALARAWGVSERFAYGFWTELHVADEGSDCDKFEMTWERWQHAWKHLGALATGLGAPATSLVAPRITVNKPVNKDIFENVAGVPGNHSYYSSFNDFLISGIQFVSSSMNIYSYPSTHSISGQAAGRACEQSEVRRGVALCKLRGMCWDQELLRIEMHSDSVIERIERSIWIL
jgi:hypothetical protein